MVYSGASSAIYLENSSVGTGTSANDSGLNELDLLCNRTMGDKLDGSMGDLLIYNRVLTTDELTQLQTWLDLRK